MSVDIKPFLQYLEKEKNIKKEEACALIVEAIKSSVEKSVMAGQNVEINADPVTGKLDAFVVLRVTDSVSDPLQEINPVAASLIEADVKVGQEVRKPINVADLGRIAAKTTQQLLNQRFRKIEKDQVFQEYKDKVGDIVTGTVRRTERGNVIIELGTAEAVLTHKERCHGDEFRTGDRIRCLLQTVTIAAMARDPGYRTKIAVDSRDPKVDPVGACVGARGARVRNIVKELGGEKIDIIRYHAEPLKLLEEAIRPAKPRNVRIDERTRSIHFEVDEDDMRIAIGSKGRNARLTSKLMGWGLNIQKATHAAESFEAKAGDAAVRIADQLGLPAEPIAKFVGLGISSVEALEGATVEDFKESGIPAEEVEAVLAAYAKGRRS